MPESYGLPDPTPSPDDLQRALEANGEDLSTIGMALAGSIGETLAANVSDLSKVQRSLAQSLRAKQGQNNKDLQHVMGQLGAALQGASVANDADLGAIRAAAPGSICDLHPELPACHPPPGFTPPSFLPPQPIAGGWYWYVFCAPIDQVPHYIIGPQAQALAEIASAGGRVIASGGPYQSQPLANEALSVASRSQQSAWNAACAGGGMAPPAGPPPLPSSPPGPIPPGTTAPPSPSPAQNVGAGTSCDNPLFVQICVESPSTCPAPSAVPSSLTATTSYSYVPYESGQPATLTTVAGKTPTNGQAPTGGLITAVGGNLLGVGGGNDFVPPAVDESGIPGTMAWCQKTIATLQQQWPQVAAALNADVGLLSDPNIDIVGIAKWVLNQFGPVGSALAAVLGKVCDGKITFPVNKIIADVAAIITRTPCFADPAVTPILLVRGVLRSLHTIRLGWDLAVWGTLDINVYLPEIEKWLDYLINYLCPTEIPDVADAAELWVKGVITDEQAYCWTQCHGMYWGHFQLITQGRYERLSPHELIEYQRRLKQDDAWIARKLMQRGLSDGEDQVIQQTLYDELPTSADFLHWLTRNVYDSDYVAQYKLLDGFEDRYLATFGDDLHAAGIQDKYSQYHYAAHWILPPPTQLQEFVYRLRPDKPGVQNPVTTDDYERLLAEQDVAPWARPRYAETVYRVPALGYLRDMFRQGIISAEELRSYHQDLGYSEPDSSRFVRIDNIIRLRMRAAESHGWVPSSIGRAHAVGVLDTATAEVLMDDLGWTNDEARAMMERSRADLDYWVKRRAMTQAVRGVVTSVQQAVGAGIMTEQDASNQMQQLGYDQRYADAIASTARAQADIRLANRTISAIRASYLSGRIDDNQATQSLNQVGVIQDRIGGYLADWALTRRERTRTRSAGQIVSDVAHGYITTADAINRLHNLEYSDEDALLFLADANRKQLAIEGQMVAAEERLAAKRQAALDKAHKAAVAAEKATLAALNKEASRTTLMKWLKKGEITREQFVELMQQRGYADDYIAKYAEQATS